MSETILVSFIIIGAAAWVIRCFVKPPTPSENNGCSVVSSGCCAGAIPESKKGEQDHHSEPGE